MGGGCGLEGTRPAQFLSIQYVRNWLVIEEVLRQWEDGNQMRPRCRLSLVMVGVAIYLSFRFQCHPVPILVGMALQAGHLVLGCASFPAIHTGEGQQPGARGGWMAGRSQTRLNARFLAN